MKFSLIIRFTPHLAWTHWANCIVQLICAKFWHVNGNKTYKSMEHPAISICLAFPVALFSRGKEFDYWCDFWKCCVGSQITLQDSSRQTFQHRFRICEATFFRNLMPDEDTNREHQVHPALLVISPYQNFEPAVDYCCWLTSVRIPMYSWLMRIITCNMWLLDYFDCWSVGAGSSLAERCAQELRNCISRRHFSLSWAGALQFTRLSVNTIFVNQAEQILPEFFNSGSSKTRFSRPGTLEICISWRFGNFGT